MCNWHSNISIMTYPTISHFIESITGYFIPLPIQTFGLFIVLAFLFGRYFIYKELLRKKKLGHVHEIVIEETKYGLKFIISFIINSIISFCFGYKIIYLISNYSSFSMHPQLLILNNEGNYITGIIFLLFYCLNYLLTQEKNKTRRTTTINPEKLSWNLLFIAAISGIVGAKLFSVLENFNYFIQDPISTIFSFSGLTFYGGLIFGTICVTIYAKINRISFFHLADIFAPSLLLSYGIGRLGCHFSGDGDWGIVSNMSNKPFYVPDWFWGYKFPHNVIEAGERIEGCVGKYCYQLTQEVYPTSLYEALFGIIGFLFLWRLRKKIIEPGVLFLIYLIINGFERFTIESIRVTEKYQVFIFQLTQAQIIAIIITFLGLIGILLIRNRQKHESI